MTNQHNQEQTRKELSSQPGTVATLEPAASTVKELGLPARGATHVTESHAFLEADRNEFYTRY